MKELTCYKEVVTVLDVLAKLPALLPNSTVLAQFRALASFPFGMQDGVPPLVGGDVACLLAYHADVKAKEVASIRRAALAKARPLRRRLQELVEAGVVPSARDGDGVHGGTGAMVVGAAAAVAAEPGESQTGTSQTGTSQTERVEDGTVTQESSVPIPGSDGEVERLLAQMGGHSGGVGGGGARGEAAGEELGVLVGVYRRFLGRVSGVHVRW
ncbi:hypothetical protein HDU96_010976 [Phlyctochytrium bullatum]|nr:hypothetical protein HDU96_010976 [Phlyctochytrium bullatum]